MARELKSKVEEKVEVKEPAGERRAHHEMNELRVKNGLPPIGEDGKEVKQDKKPKDDDDKA